MRLTGKQFAQLQMVILAAFTRDELRRLLKVDLDTSLELITGDKGFEAQVFDLLLWLERQGRLLEFVECARTANPANQELATACTAVQRKWDSAGARRADDLQLCRRLSCYPRHRMGHDTQRRAAHGE